MSGLVLTVKTCGFRTIWNSLRMPREPPEPREPGKWWQDPQLGPPIPHAPGARMTAVTQIPSNNINSRLKGAVDRELGGKYIRSFPNFRFLCLCENTICLVRFFSIHPVQNVINSVTQLSGRGFPHIFHMRLLLSQLCVFWYF